MKLLPLWALPALLAGTVPSQPAKAPSPSPRRVLRDAVDWLVRHQYPDGGWGSHESARVYKILCDVPGSHRAFRVATSALCVIALEESPYEPPAAVKAASRGIDYLLGAYDVKRPNGVEHYNVWSFGYTLQCFGDWLRRHPGDRRNGAIRKASAELVRKLGIYQCTDGGWGYLSLGGVPTYRPSDTSMSFTTATDLVGLARAKAAGLEVPRSMIRKALGLMERCLTPRGSFLYGYYLRYRLTHGINGPKGSACRTPACQYSMLLFGRDFSRKARLEALENLLLRFPRFQKIAVREPIPHHKWYSISGYFYLYGHAYAAWLLDTLPEKDRERFREPLFRGVMFCREPDGSFWDYPLYGYHKPYGTAFAVIALSRVVSGEKGKTR